MNIRLQVREIYKLVKIPVFPIIKEYSQEKKISPITGNIAVTELSLGSLEIYPRTNQTTIENQQIIVILTFPHFHFVFIFEIILSKALFGLLMKINSVTLDKKFILFYITLLIVAEPGLYGLENCLHLQSFYNYYILSIKLLFIWIRIEAIHLRIRIRTSINAQKATNIYVYFCIKQKTLSLIYIFILYYIFV